MTVAVTDLLLKKPSLNGRLRAALRAFNIFDVWSEGEYVLNLRRAGFHEVKVEVIDGFFRDRSAVGMNWRAKPDVWGPGNGKRKEGKKGKKGKRGGKRGRRNAVDDEEEHWSAHRAAQH